jgi:hypothetical protein
MSFGERITFYCCAVVAGAVFGALALCGVAYLDQLHGFVIPWHEVMVRGATIGAIGGSVGGLWIFKP